MWKVLLGLLIFSLLAFGWLLWVMLRPMLFARRVDRALRQFGGDRPRLESLFFEKSAASGKPRGLSWKSCAFQNGLVLARDRVNGEFVGLVGVTIGFEAVEGGGMEDVEAVGNLRAATAVFTWNGTTWDTAGRAVFNLEPREVLERYESSLDRIAT